MEPIATPKAAIRTPVYCEPCRMLAQLSSFIVNLKDTDLAELLSAWAAEKTAQHILSETVAGVVGEYLLAL
jgi:hypothetical protein